MTETHHSSQPRQTYHHGHLHEVLVKKGLEMARSGGTEAVVLREATRRAGVSPNAAYRHFANREALLDEVGLAVELSPSDLVTVTGAVTAKISC
jgi:hypothetical protein